MQARLDPRGKVLNENKKKGTENWWGDPLYTCFVTMATYIIYLM